MRRYGQFCGLARALDIVGDRWTLLLLRELAIRPARFSDLRDGLPGMATNLLADRLRTLEANGVIERYTTEPPGRVTAYRLTDRGRELGPALLELARWGRPLLLTGQGDDEFRGRWIKVALMALYRGIDPTDLEPFTARIGDGTEFVVLRVGPSGIDVVDDEPGDTDLHVEAEPSALMAMIAGASTTKDVARLVHGPAAKRRAFALLAERAATLATQ